VIIMRNSEAIPSPFRTAFTLIELMVVMVIITILASLSLAGMAGARQRAKIEKTKSTIRKIDSVIQPMYDSYRTRRVSVAVTGASRINNANTVLIAKRGLMTREMPDSWDDVPATLSVYNGLSPSYQTPIVRMYTNYRIANTGATSTSLTTSSTDARTTSTSASECLYLIMSRSGYDPDVLETFRAEEVVDTDGDGAKEFADGWGKPIAFMRWSPGFASPVQANGYSSTQHDPLDPLRTDPTAYALRPLVYSAGPDETYGLVTMSGTTVSGTTHGWAQLSLGSICTLRVSGANITSWNGNYAGNIDPTDPTAARDNITNHDLLKR